MALVDLVPERKPNLFLTRVDYQHSETCNGCGQLGDRREMVIWYLAKYSEKNIVPHYVHNKDYCKNKAHWICGQVFVPERRS